MQSLSRYPKNEPHLLPKIHIRRAIGGPLSSLLLTLITGGLAWVLYSIGGILKKPPSEFPARIYGGSSCLVVFWGLLESPW